MSTSNDYGILNGVVTTAPSPVTNKRTQVWIATHDGADQRLPHYLRSFISFAYGGKLIEDFGFITITKDNSLSRQLYAEFEDTTTESDVYDGQIYWATHFKANRLTLNLYTDGVTEKQLEEFKAWFKPGIIRELVLAQHPNRAILARVGDKIDMNMLPFEGNDTIKIANQEYKIKTTLYRGGLTLTFVMDNPFWYAINNILDIAPDNFINNQPDANTTPRYIAWIDANGNSIAAINSLDALKVIYEDGIPTRTMLSNLMPSLYVMDNNNDGIPELITNEIGLQESVFLCGQDIAYKIISDFAKVGAAQVGFSRISETEPANNQTENQTQDMTGFTLYQQGETLNDSRSAFLYYPGTAPCLPKIQFTIKPIINQDGFISFPANMKASLADSYSIITFKSIHQYNFYFTTPSIWTGYNQAVEVFKESIKQNTTASWQDIRQLLRDNVKHFAPRNYAIKVVDQVEAQNNTNNNSNSNNTSQPTTNDLSNILSLLPEFLGIESSQGAQDLEGAPATFIFDSETGEAIGQFKYREAPNEEIINNPLEEDVGDMVKSSYLKLEDRNQPDEDGYLAVRTDEHPNYSYQIINNSYHPITDVHITYKIRYL